MLIQELTKHTNSIVIGYSIKREASDELSGKSDLLIFTMDTWEVYE